jgi:membrane-bound lytic murein transglycosylase
MQHPARWLAMLLAGSAFMQHLARWLSMSLAGSAIHATSGSLAGDVAGWLCHSCNIWLAGSAIHVTSGSLAGDVAGWLCHSCNIWIAGCRCRWLALPFMQHLARWLSMSLAGSAIHATSGSLAVDVAGWLRHSCNIWLAGWRCCWLAPPFM